MTDGAMTGRFGPPVTAQHNTHDTIVAVATPPGRGGIGILRLSGPDSATIATEMVRLRTPLAPGRVRRGDLLDADSGAVLDEVVLTFFAAPRSYTGEDVVELACHGAPVLLDYGLRRARALGARLAEPGEFTQRAFLAGRLDLSQAEAVHDLVAARTLEQARVAAAQLGGALARRVAPAKEALVNLIAELEAGVDFAEDDLDLLPAAELEHRLAALVAGLAPLEATFGFGRVLREGLSLAIVGKPNVGKSSLFNRLLGQQRAIVTDQPGTTRDPIAESLAFAGVPIRLLDTAGIRETPEGAAGEIERQGVERTWQALAEADLVLLVTASAGSPEPLDAQEQEIVRRIADRPHLLIRNKVDLHPTTPSGTAEAVSGPSGQAHWILTSATTGQGMEELQAALRQHLHGTASLGEPALLTNLRQHEAVAESLHALQAALAAARAGQHHELLLLNLYAALAALDRLTGATEPDEILSRIFSRFCIGK